METLIKHISKQYKKIYIINEIKSYDVSENTNRNYIIANVTRKDNGFTFDDAIGLDINIKQVLREEKLNQLGI